MTKVMKDTSQIESLMSDQLRHSAVDFFLFHIG
jgi:hypothetical protein